MISNSRLIFESFAFIFECTIILVIPLGFFFYSFKRKFRVRLFNFGDRVHLFFFSGFMIFILILFVFFSQKLLQTGNIYQRLLTSGIATEAKIFYQGYRPGGMAPEIGVDFFDLSEIQQKNYVNLDPVNYYLVRRENSLRIHYNRDNPEEIVLDEFPPRINPAEIIIVFSSFLLLVTGGCIWAKRDNIGTKISPEIVPKVDPEDCLICRELNAYVAIRTSDDLRKILKKAKRYMAEGTLSVLHARSSASIPFDRIKPDGPWVEDLEYLFQCNTCRVEFGLSSRPFRKDQEPYIGLTGRWFPL